MDAEDLALDEGAQGQHIEELVEHFPHFEGYLPLALLVEAHVAVGGGNLMAAPQQKNVLGVAKLIGHEEDNTLQRHGASVDIIAEEEVVRISWLP